MVAVTPDGETHVQVELMRWSALLPPCEVDVDPLKGTKKKLWQRYLSSTEWGHLMREIRAYAPEMPDIDAILVGDNAIARNAKTDNLEEVEMLNRFEAGRMDFQARRRRLISGRVPGA